jgi:hypothetical protein
VDLYRFGNGRRYWEEISLGYFSVPEEMFTASGVKIAYRSGKRAASPSSSPVHILRQKRARFHGISKLHSPGTYSLHAPLCLHDAIFLQGRCLFRKNPLRRLSL